MKRHRESGAAYKRRREEKEKEAAKSRDSLLKYFNPNLNSSQSSSQSVEVNPTELSPQQVIQDIPEVADVIPQASPEECSNEENSEEESANAIGSEISALNELTCSSESQDFIEVRNSEVLQKVNVDVAVAETSTQSNEIPNDAGLWPELISDELRVYLVKQGPDQVRHMNAKFASQTRPASEKSKGLVRNLTKNWFYKVLENNQKTLRTWMLYSPAKGSLVCFCCRLFDRNSSQSSSFSKSDGFKNWLKLSPKVDEHEASALHCSTFFQWKTLEIGLMSGKTIDFQHQESVLREEKKWRDILKRILDVILFLARQNLSLRGHRESYKDSCVENHGNFLELIHFLSNYDSVLAEHLTRVKLSNKLTPTYLSPEIQNEFINLLGDHVRRRIISDVNDAKYFSIIFDSTPDISHKDQTSQVIRYVKISGTEVEVVESFIDFIETHGKTAEQISSMILKKLETDGLDIQNCRGQAYDNAATMAGIRNGVQSKIREINPKATFIPCSNHSLNLAGVHAASVSASSVTFFGTLERIFVYFSSSTQRWDALLQVTKQGVKRLVDTRWSSRHDAVAVIKNHFEEILEVLEKLNENHNENAKTRSDAGILLCSLRTFSFLGYLSLWSTVLSEINDTQKYLQRQGLNVKNCAEKVAALKIYLETNREKIVTKAAEYATLMCEKLDISVTSKRTKKRKQIHGDGSEGVSLTPAQELSREMYGAVDRIIEEITTRFQQLDEIRQKYSFLFPESLLDPQKEDNFDFELPDDVNREDFNVERDRLRNFCNAANHKVETFSSDPLSLLKFIQRYQREISVPNIVIMLKIFLSFAVSVASCERSFSKLKLIKNYLRSQMSSLRLRNLAILSIERKLTNEIDFDDLIKEFAARKARRINI
ncbi:zinc finger MYM-type protein 1-like [Photinus pyralis]|uniref:zinc finger MYM-type protein 1-like n=2 Tax=Photinus pyralis TaxID=7054 RepID=UPI0012671D3C|nr:zinc finger MYM-type protein 1-like [Photinus pyralis]